MLEIIIVWQLCKKIGNILRDKGRSPGLYQFLTVVLWFGGEVTGMIGSRVLTTNRGSRRMGSRCWGRSSVR